MHCVTESSKGKNACSYRVVAFMLKRLLCYEAFV